VKPASKIIPLRLIEARNEKGWSQAEVAEKIRVDTNTYSRWERGETFPNSYAREKLTEVYGKSPEELGLLKSRTIETAAVTQIIPTIPYEDREMLLNPILGREREIDKILRFLQDDNSPLVTITGTGGVGKTRLELEIQEQVNEDSRYTSIYISLASLPNNSPILPTIGEQLGLSQPKLLEKVIAALKVIPADRVLVVLDNFEHVNTPENRDVLVDLLIGCKKKLQLLVTSRIALRVDYEQVVRLRPLKVPKLEDIKDPKDLEHYPATLLYLQRAKKIKEEFDATENDAPFIVNICHLLDGLPLAIKLVAAKILTHTPESTYQALLRDVLGVKGEITNTYYINVPKRQINLYNTIEWSYNLLGEKEKKLFRRLAVFAGKCWIESAIYVCNSEDDLPFEKPEFTSIVNALSDHDLVTFENERIKIAHSTLHDFALQILEEKEAEMLGENYVDFYAQLAVTFVLSNIVSDDNEKMDFMHRLGLEEKGLEEVLQKKAPLGILVLDEKGLKTFRASMRQELDNFYHVYHTLSWRRFVDIEIATARLLGEEEEKAIRRIKARENDDDMSLGNMTKVEFMNYARVRNQVERSSEIPYNYEYFYLQNMLRSFEVENFLKLL